MDVKGEMDGNEIGLAFLIKPVCRVWSLTFSNED